MVLPYVAVVLVRLGEYVESVLTVQLTGVDSFVLTNRLSTSPVLSSALFSKKAITNSLPLWVGASRTKERKDH